MDALSACMAFSARKIVSLYAIRHTPGGSLYAEGNVEMNLWGER